MSEGTIALNATGRYLALSTAFLGWFFAGMLLSTSTVGTREAAIDLLSKTGAIDLEQFEALSAAAPERPSRTEAASTLTTEQQSQLRQWRVDARKWFAYFQCAMLFGAAAGGLLFGRLGDRIGRSKAMACSILCYSLLSAVAYFSETPTQFWVLWFLACLGIGGMWPNGIALVSETWSNMSRPLVAGIMGASANVGIFAMATAAFFVRVTPDHWRWMLLVCAAPAVLGIFVLAAVPESPRWLAARAVPAVAGVSSAASVGDVFRPPLLGVTLIGIVLATVPLVGGWGSASWMVPWAGEAGDSAQPRDPFLKAQVNQLRSLPGIPGTLLGGWMAHVFGRRQSFCFISLACLFCAQFAFWFLIPTDTSFLYWVAALGFFSGMYFGWLPLFLPELFPTRVRATGSGVSFNFGRFLTAITVFATGTLVVYFQGNYAQIGRITSLIFAVGAIVIWFAPDTSQRQLAD